MKKTNKNLVRFDVHKASKNNLRWRYAAMGCSERLVPRLGPIPSININQYQSMLMDSH